MLCHKLLFGLTPPHRAVGALAPGMPPSSFLPSLPSFPPSSLPLPPPCAHGGDADTMRLAKDLSIDAELLGNEARFINDYRGIGGRVFLTWACFFNSSAMRRPRTRRMM